MGLWTEENTRKHSFFPLTFLNLFWDGMELHYLHFSVLKKNYLPIYTPKVKGLLFSIDKDNY